jgi:hypothetical protein
MGEEARKSKGKRQISKGKSVELAFSNIKRPGADLLPFDICLLPFAFLFVTPESSV